jgi:WD40 repeat protein
VTCLAIFGDHLISGSWKDDKTIRIWNARTGDCTHIMKEHDQAVSCLAVWNNRLYSGSWDKTIRVWNLEVQLCFFEVTLQGWATRICSRRT